MRKFLLIALTVFASTLVFAQKSSDPDLNKRLKEYMKLTEELKFDEIMDYTHPKIFEVAPKEQLVELFKQSFENEAMSISFDSTGITTVSEPFKVKETSYRKIDYWMSINVALKDTASLKDEGYVSMMKTALGTGFPDGKIEYNKTKKRFEITASSIMIAIKDNATAPWMFLGYQKNDALLKVLYPQEVIDHFKLL